MIAAGEIRDRLHLPAWRELPRAAQVAAAIAFALVGWWACALLTPNGASVGIVVIGAVLGSATGLAAVGIILVWRANRVVNFAAGALGGAAGLTAVQLFLTWEWPYPVAIVAATLFGFALGALVEVVIIRRFAQAPRLVLTVATIGLAQLLGGLELELPKRAFDVETVVLGAFETPLTSTRFELGPVIITGDHLLVALVVPVVVAALAWFLKRSLAGTAIRAASENTDRARLLGVPVRNLTTVVWALAGALAALTFVLRAPFLGATPSAIAGPAVMLPALAAAVVGRMESMPVAFGAAVSLGVVDQIVRWNTSSPELVDVVLLVVIVAALLLQRGSRSRAHDADGGWRDAELIRPLAPAVARLRAVRWSKHLGLAALVAAAVVVPMVVGPGTANSLSIMAIWGLVAVSLVVLTGWGGQISLGQFALVGVGAIVAGNMVSRWNVDLFITLAAAAGAGALAALLLGLPALRIRGPFLAVVTLAFAVVLDGYVLNPNVFPALIPQDVDRPLLWGRVDLEDERSMLWFCLAGLALGIALARGVRRSRSGRLLIAARDNAKAAEAASVSTRWVTLSGFVFSGVLTGLAGGLHVLLLHGARVGSYQPVQSIEVFSMATIGGLGSIGGAVSGAAGMRGMQDLDATVRLVVAGVGVLLVLWLIPSGLAGLAARLRDRLVAPIARRHGLDLEGRELPDADVATETATDASAGSPARLTAVPSPDHRAAHGHRAAHDDSPADDRPSLPAPTAPALHAPPPYLGIERAAAAPANEPLPAPATDAAPALLSARGVDVSYGRLQVLFDLDLDVHDGEIVALLGTNGAGKSTILKAICGLIPHSGTVQLGGIDISGRSAEQIVRSGIALMPGGRAVFPTLTVDDHLRLATWTFRSDTERIAEDLDEVRRIFPILAERHDQLAGDLSGGEQQQLALAMTLMLRPEVLLIDELSLGLAPVVVGALCEVVRSLNATGITVVVVEQSVNVALTLAERAVFLEKGRTRFEGPTRELLERPDVLRSVFIAGADAVADRGDADEPAEAEDREAARAVRNVDLTLLRGGRTEDDEIDLRAGDGDPDQDQDPAVLVCSSVTKRFGGVNALSDVELRIEPGEIVGLIGQNGAGKTTLMDCISGFHTVDDGSVVFRGVDITRWEPHERARGRLGRTFQEARLFPSLTVLETIEVACERSVTSRSLVADATRQPASYLAEAATAERAEELAHLLGLGGYAHVPTSALSTGTRRIVELACLLAEDPVLMLLDEPSAGVAQKETEALGPLLRQIRDHTGAAMLIIEHDMPLLSGVCDRLVAMELGTVIAQGPPDEVLEHPAVVASYLGTDEAAIHRSGAGATPA
jgi:ABC-type branched-subunit amino acid transport system ATPase component/ABC-type branched-subunit amino acid transport system permease subunit